MGPNEVYKRFVLLFPYIGDKVDVWFSNGKNSIRVRSTNAAEFIFTFDADADWRLETVGSFIKRQPKGGKR